MPSLRATIFATAAVAFSLVAPLSAFADSGTSPTPVAAAGPGDAGIASKGTATVTLGSCTTGGSAGRSVLFAAEMTAASNSAAMEIRFDLFTRPLAGGSWVSVKGLEGSGIGTWDRSKATIFSGSKNVHGLAVGQSYRVVVSHRWLSKTGRVIRRVVLVSRSCNQPDMRPDLALSFLGARKLSGGNMLYTVVLRNTGFGAAGGFSVGMRVNDVELPTLRVRSIGSRKSIVMTFTAAGCAPGSMLRLETDFSNEIAELNEANNVVETACPIAGG